METTIAVWNETLFENAKPENQVHAWLRAIAANQLARTAREWCEIFYRYNSGTYNNQWIILDYKNFQPYKPLPDYDLLFVLEQMPGLIEYEDVSKSLKENTYFATYNIPILPKIFKLSGYDKMEESYDWFSRTNSARAKIFKRDHSKVVNLETLQTLMRYNNFTRDTLSRCNCTPPYTAQATISARGDLNDPNGTYPLWRMSYGNHGALDYKGNNYQLFKRLEFRALSSPPYENVPPFQWSKFALANKVKHVGHPDLWKFDCIETKWETLNINVKI
uniref:Phospholipase B-like n=1 Tax=Panagrolaimus sp. ES5 TaxID=591445 RepID=A0AC34FH14_9BILA